MSIQITQVTKKFGAFTALKNISFEVGTGELVALLGPSGSGKTTLLRVIAGLEPADAGSVAIHGNEMTDKKITDRKVGFVFQHYALFRHMTVFENVAFGLKVRTKATRPSDEEIKKRALELLKLVRLEGMSSRYPSQLSGGQRQRVALARALAIEPKMLLLDEPFGSLDAKVRKELRQWLKQLHDRLKMTSIFVTHDQEEALEVADRIVILNEGRIEQIGTPEEVYQHPANPFVFDFLGNVNLFHCRLEGGKAYLGDIAIQEGIQTTAKQAKVYIRPHLLEIQREPKKNAITGTVRFINAAGPLVKVEVLAESGETILIELPRERHQALQLKREEKVFVIPREAKFFTDDYTI